MKLRPILRAEAHTAASLLAEGFPVHALETWRESIQLLFSHVATAEDGSIGSIASAGGRDVGIGLAIAARRTAYEAEPRDIVNLAAFYMRSGHEWMTTPFLRRMMKNPDVEYIDLTASVAMREVNRRLGFTDRSEGMVVIPTLAAAMRPGRGVRIRPAHAVPPGAMSEDHRRLLARHGRLNAISLAVEIDGELHPLILARSFRRRVGGARVILARDRELIRTALGPLSRLLLKYGILFLEFDACSKETLREAIFVSRFAPVQTTRPSDNPAIDHTFSELMFIPPPRVGPLLSFHRRHEHGGASLPFPLGLADFGLAAPMATGVALCIAETVFA